tara:strand:+ start:25270 stop:25815 length:546 start_codon:yes stop_codon:yes gene_type:complete
MKIKSLPIQGSYEVELSPFGDSRGIFKRLFCREELKKIISKKEIAQVNFSETYSKGSIRGMHFQKPPNSEIKLIHCIQGSVFDVIIDLRRSSKTFLHWNAIELSNENNNMIIIPEGCAHGFQSLAEHSKLIYFHTEFYKPESESGIKYDDPLINIKWPLDISNISIRDESHDFLEETFKGL